MKQIHKLALCEVCDRKLPKRKLLDLGKQPLCDDLIKVGSKSKNKKYPIELYYCNNCFTVHHKYQIPKRNLFPKDYHYRSRFTNDVLNGMQNLVKDVEKKYKSLKNKVVLDIGCNDGSLLDYFKKSGAITIGVEPTNSCAEAKKKKHNVYNEYFSEQNAHKIKNKFVKIDFITFTNVFAHIEDLKLLINNLKILISNETKLIIENHYLGSVINKFQFDTFYHEHPRTYSLKSFTFIAKSLGLQLEKVTFPSRYGGNIRVFLGRQKPNTKIINNIKSKIKSEKNFRKQLKQFQPTIEKWITNTTLKLENIFQEEGLIIAKAFPGRASILVSLLKLDEHIIKCTYEKEGSIKIGHYIPGTKIPILSDNELLKLKTKPKVILNFAWHISKEINFYLKKNKLDIKILDILDPKEYKIK